MNIDMDIHTYAHINDHIKFHINVTITIHMYDQKNVHQNFHLNAHLNNYFYFHFNVHMNMYMNVDMNAHINVYLNGSINFHIKMIILIFIYVCTVCSSYLKLLCFTKEISLYLFGRLATSFLMCSIFQREKSKKVEKPSCPSFLPQYLLMYQLNATPPPFGKT